MSESATETKTETKPEPGRGSEGQTFLVGEHLYLRGIEADDAKRASAWRGSPFPVSAARAEEILKKQIPEEAENYQTRLVACRRSDDEPVGAVWYRHWDWRTALLRIFADPALGTAGQEARAELLRLVAPWLTQERHVMVLWFDADADEAPVQDAARDLGMRRAIRLREARWRDGARRDEITYELLHPAWVKRLGDPYAENAADADPGAAPRLAAPHPRAVASLAAPPRNAVMTGERIFLRPVEIEDLPRMARWSRQETETFYQNGRWINSPAVSAHWIREQGEKEPPQHIELGIALRETGELIGECGHYDISWINRSAETGSYIYRPEYRGKGYGSEAKHLLLEFGFERLGFHMLRSFVWAPNTRSAAALRKQGYRDAGRLHWTSQKDGEWVDDLVFDLLAEEWRNGVAK